MSVEHPNRTAIAEERLAGLFRSAGWQVNQRVRHGDHEADMVVRQGPLSYVIELKSLAEGRSDRVLPLLSQAILVARSYARELNMNPLAVVHVGAASESLLQSVQTFHKSYAPDMAVGLVTENGDAHFIGSGLEGLNRREERPSFAASPSQLERASDLYSDLNQLMLKLLLARELPEHMLSAPRRDYQTASELAKEAKASPMSASRFVRRLQEEGFLEHSGRAFRLVRRAELFFGWKSAALRSSPEMRMVYLAPGPRMRRLLEAADKMEGCVGLFEAAELLKVGHVSGVPPYLYLRRLVRPMGWPGLVPARDGEAAQVILKQPNFPVSLFRVAVPIAGGAMVTDVLQIWLDVSAHPSRGQEQADHLQQTVLRGVLGDAR